MCIHFDHFNVTRHHAFVLLRLQLHSVHFISLGGTHGALRIFCLFSPKKKVKKNNFKEEKNGKLAIYSVPLRHMGIMLLVP